MQIVEHGRERENEIGARLRVLGIATIYGVAGERWRVAKVLKPPPAIRTSTIHSADPRHTYADAFRQCVRCAIHNISHNLVAWNYMWKARRKFAFGYMEIGAAHATGTHFQKNVPRL
jgi:hypothetical protein